MLFYKEMLKKTHKFYHLVILISLLSFVIVAFNLLFPIKIRSVGNSDGDKGDGDYGNGDHDDEKSDN